MVLVLSEYVRSAYTGYIDVEARHLFFYFFESRRDPSQDDVIFWTNGGPGGSSALGLFTELGPCTLNKDGNSTTYNPYSWNEYANVFFVEQPVGVGFSYADHGESVVSETFFRTNVQPHLLRSGYYGRSCKRYRSFRSDLLQPFHRVQGSGLPPGRRVLRSELPMQVCYSQY